MGITLRWGKLTRLFAVTLRYRGPKNWRGIKSRCTDRNLPSFKHYGGRGISICEEWLNSFAGQEFLTNSWPSSLMCLLRRSGKLSRGEEYGNRKWRASNDGIGGNHMRKGSSICPDGLAAKIDVRLPNWLRTMLQTEADRRCLKLSALLRCVLEEYVRPGSWKG